MSLRDQLTNSLRRCHQQGRSRVERLERFAFAYAPNHIREQRLFFAEHLPRRDHFLSLHAPNEEMPIIAQPCRQFVVGDRARREPDDFTQKLIEAHHALLFKGDPLSLPNRFLESEGRFNRKGKRLLHGEASPVQPHRDIFP